MESFLFLSHFCLCGPFRIRTVSAGFSAFYNPRTPPQVSRDFHFFSEASDTSATSGVFLPMST